MKNGYCLKKPELLYFLREQLYFLDRSLLNFSRCDTVESLKNRVIGSAITLKIESEIEAKRLAVIVRTLLHDTSKSTSLLSHLSVKSHFKYIDTKFSNDERLHSMTGMHGVEGSPNQYIGLVAKVNDGNSLLAVPLFMQHLPEWYQSYQRKSFEQWWGDVIIDINGHKQTRNTLILNVANKDGGAHVDESQPMDYHAIKNTNVRLKVNGIQTPFERNVVYASVAQIAWELLNSVDDIF